MELLCSIQHWQQLLQATHRGVSVDNPHLGQRLGIFHREVCHGPTGEKATRYTSCLVLRSEIGMAIVQGYLFGQCNHLLLRTLHVLDEALTVKNQDSCDSMGLIEAA
jgi:hypothetical protein